MRSNIFQIKSVSQSALNQLNSVNQSIVSSINQSINQQKYICHLSVTIKKKSNTQKRETSVCKTISICHTLNQNLSIRIRTNIRIRIRFNLSPLPAALPTLAHQTRAVAAAPAQKSTPKKLTKIKGKLHFYNEIIESFIKDIFLTHLNKFQYILINNCIQVL